jgi:hypothetical protein
MVQDKYLAPYGKKNYSVPAGLLEDISTLPVVEEVH